MTAEIQILNLLNVLIAAEQEKQSEMSVASKLDTTEILKAQE